MLISKCHLSANVDSKNENALNCHSGMLLSRNPGVLNPVNYAAKPEGTSN